MEQPQQTPALTLEEATRIIEDAFSKLKEDAGAFHEPAVIEAARFIAQSDAPAYARLRQRLKVFRDDNGKKVVTVTDWEKSVKAGKEGNGELTQYEFGCKLMDAKTVPHAGDCTVYPPVGVFGKLFTVDPLTNLWKPQTPIELSVEVSQVFNGYPKCTNKTHYTQIANHTIDMATNKGFFAEAPLGLATPGGFHYVENGVLKFATLTPKHRQTQIVDYTPMDGPMPFFVQFMNDAFIPVEDPTPEKAAEGIAQINLVQEIIGALLLGLTAKHQVCILLHERYGNAGKSVLLDIFGALINEGDRTAVPPSQWEDKEFLAEIAGKKLNLAGDISDKWEDAIKGPKFKQVIGHDLLTTRHLYGDPFTFRNTATHIFACNGYPATRDQSDAFFRRQMIIDLPNSRTRLNLPIDADLAKKIIASELPQIAAWGLHGALRLIKNGCFTLTNTHYRCLAEWRNRANSVMAFVSESCILHADYRIPTKELHMAYRDWCINNDHKVSSAQSIRNILESAAHLKVTHRNMFDTTYYFGIQTRR